MNIEGNLTHVETLPLGFNIALARFVMSQAEQDAIFSYCEDIWPQVTNERYQGLIRFDLAGTYIDEQFEVVGVYEINTNGPECIALDIVASQSVFGYESNYTKRVVEVMRCNLEGKVAFFPGMISSLKQTYFKQCKSFLEGEWPDLDVITSQDDLHAYDHIWRWGDCRSEGETHYTPKEMQVLRDLGDRVVAPYYDNIQDDPGFKGRLPGVRRLTDIAEHELVSGKINYVLKPLNGSSGNGVIVGRFYDDHAWQQEVQKLKGAQNYGVSPFLEHPLVQHQNEKYVFDLCISFFARGSALTPIGYFSRFHQDHLFNGKMNVAQGAFISSFSSFQE